MATWADLEAAAPDIAVEGRRLLYRSGEGEALLATVRDGAAPRIHPINVGIVDGELVAFILRSVKLTDLSEDGRYALHAHIDPAAPSELMVRGRATEIPHVERRAAAAAVWPFEIDETYRLFAFGIESAHLGRRDTPDVWPPAYERWAVG